MVRKRKLPASQGERKSSKLSISETKPADERADELEAEHPWRNLQLILSLQNKNIDMNKKVELAFAYVRKIEENPDDAQGLETVSISKVIGFLNNWIQSLLISSEKKIRAEDYMPPHEIIGSVFDFRCWNILKYCLEESLRQHLSLSFSKDFLRVVQCIVKAISSRLSVVSEEWDKTILVVVHCVSLVFSSHGGVLNENLDLWILSVDAVLVHIQGILDQNLEGSRAGVLGVKLTSLVLEPFAKFLRIHPNKKNGFRDFVDKLLVPLLHLLDLLHSRTLDCNPMLNNLTSLIEDVLSHGLFHPSQMDGLLSLQSTRKYITCEDGKPIDSNISIQSFHRHLFVKLEKICLGKNVVALNGVGQMFYLFAHCVKRHRGIAGRAGLRNLGNELASDVFRRSLENNINTESDDSSASLNGETRSSLFDFFIQIMEPLLQRLNHYLEGGLETEPALVDFWMILGSVKKLIASFSSEKLYLRTEDISEGASFNFLKLLYDTLLSLSAKIVQVWMSTNDRKKGIEELNLAAKELVCAVGYLVEIEYDVVGDDLESLWFMIFSFASLGLSLSHEREQNSVTREVLHLGRQLVNLYSELRQVNTILFTLCKVVRSLISPEGLRLPVNLKFKSGDTEELDCNAYVESVCIVLCSKDVRVAIYDAVVSIPEGQVSGFIRQLRNDMSESLEWIKDNKLSSNRDDIGKLCPSTKKLHFGTRVKLFGRGLCDVYTLAMDSLTVTAGNSNLIRVSVEETIKVLGIKMKSLVAGQQDNINSPKKTKHDNIREFISTITGTIPGECDSEHTQWILLFFFCLYMCCRSIYRQTMSFVPVETSEKMSAAMGDTITAYSGKDWLERTDWNYGSYFSWIMDSPSSLVNVIQFMSDIYLINDSADCYSPLLYVLNAMAIQRLVDLNRLIKSFEYLLQRNKYLTKDRLSDVISSSINKTPKRCQKEGVSSLRKEAADLTNIVMGHLKSLSEKLMSISLSDDSNHKALNIHPQSRCGMWQISISAMKDESVPLALWWMICQSIDVWCLHAAKKKLKLFISLLINIFLIRDTASTDYFTLLGPTNGSHTMRTVAHDLSVETLRDTVFHEQRSLRRHIASSFCQSMEKSVLAIFDNVGEDCLKSSPDWTEFLAFLENSSKTSGKNLNIDGSTSVVKSIKQNSSTPRKLIFSDCIALFNLMCWMPKRYLSSKSFSLYATCFINIERLVLGSITDCQDSLYSKNLHIVLKLLLSCRRALKNLLTEFCEELMEPNQPSVAKIFFQSSAPVLWLLKTLSPVVVSLQADSDDKGTQMKEIVFSLMDQTSYVFLTLSRYQLIHESSTAIDSLPSSNSTVNFDGFNNITLVAETLKEQMHSILIQRKASCHGLEILELNNFSSVLSCSQGFWYGFAAALDHIDSETYNIQMQVSRSKHDSITKLRRCIDEFAGFVDYFVRAVFIDDQECDDETRSISGRSDDLPMLEVVSLNKAADATEREQHECETLRNCFTSSADKDQTEKRVRKKKLQSQNADFRNNVFSKCDSFDLSCLKKMLLQGFVRGENPEAAFFLRQLFFAASVLLRLNLQICSAPLSLSMVPIFVGISQILIVEMGNNADLSSLVSLVWLDGVTKFLEELASHVPLTDPVLSRDVYVKMVELHFIAIGKCITLQGKSACLVSHDTESSTKTVDQKVELSESTLSNRAHSLHEFKARLRRSFQALVKKSTELHLQAALEALQKALVGLRVGSTVHYDICIESSDGGKVSSMVAAGVDCLDFVLEFVTGRKHLSIIKTHIRGLVACLFNVILHLQDRSNFFINKSSASPDPGSTILMCVEVLIRVFGKHSIYHLDSFQVAQSLRIPGAIFQNIFQLRCSETVEIPNFQRLMGNQDAETIDSTNLSDVDRKFSVDLFAACCRLLGTLIKHYKSEAERCVALLEDSVTTLLHCLEMVYADKMVKKQSFAWELEEAVRCAAFLRRIYEELRQQKEFFGRHCSLFLSSYIWTYSGYGPLKIGIGREVDEALRPGVYALIDSCPADDLQRLHTIFGEGPCRSTLANLQRDYKMNFQYEGKV